MYEEYKVNWDTQYIKTHIHVIQNYFIKSKEPSMSEGKIQKTSGFFFW